jgi:ribosomal protein S18 acetylase RimI-like enzyme
MKPASAKDKSHFVDILSKAFESNRSVNEVVLQDERRLERIQVLMDYSFEIAFEKNGAWQSDDGDAVLLGYYPIANKTTLKDFWQMGRLAFKSVGISRVRHVTKREKYIHKYHPKTPHFYLWFLGVEPSCQGQGKGGQLLNDLQAYCAQFGLPIILETSTPENLPFYQKHGFTIYHEWLVREGYTVWFLKWEQASWSIN